MLNVLDVPVRLLVAVIEVVDTAETVPKKPYLRLKNKVLALEEVLLSEAWF